ncbi:MAG TPA: ABC transporter ATP-binding protein [Holophagaceae bacterium]|nr:ABC transporter ATP-binding protein [Holophagaceae bacterium]
MAVLQAEGITKVYQEGRQVTPVLKGVSMDLHPGEIVALEGPSGSGKTTLLQILGCILSPTEGELRLEGEPILGDAARLAEIRRRSIGFVFQQYNLFPALTARENVQYALNLKGVKGPEARREAESLLGAVGLEDRLDHLPRDLSGGQKQRVAIARAMAARPAVLLADEPTANLDTAVGAQILDLFRDLARREDRALLIVTHDPKVRAVADRVLKIRDGLIEAEEAP